MKAHERLKKIEADALAIASSARDLITKEGWDREPGGHHAFQRIAQLLEEKGPMQLTDIASAMGYSDRRQAFERIKHAIGVGLVRRTAKRGEYEAVPRSERAPEAEMREPKKRKRAKQDPLAGLGKL